MWILCSSYPILVLSPINKNTWKRSLKYTDRHLNSKHSYIAVKYQEGILLKEVLFIVFSLVFLIWESLFFISTYLSKSNTTDGTISPKDYLAKILWRPFNSKLINHQSLWNVVCCEPKQNRGYFLDTKAAELNTRITYADSHAAALVSGKTIT